MHSEAGSYTPVPAPSDSVPICYDQCRPAGTFRDFSDRHPADIWSGKRINRKTGVGKMAHRPHTLRGTPDKTNRRMKSPNQSVSPSVFPSSQSRTIESTCGPYLAMKTFPIPFMSGQFLFASRKYPAYRHESDLLHDHIGRHAIAGRTSLAPCSEPFEKFRILDVFRNRLRCRFFLLFDRLAARSFTAALALVSR